MNKYVLWVGGVVMISTGMLLPGAADGYAAVGLGLIWIGSAVK